jgi:rhomboid family GlyGly-CTERM serine protease
LLEYDRERVLAGGWWRLWTAHLVHFGASHVGWNLAVFVPAAAWAERLAPGRVRLFLVIAPGGIGLALLVLEPTLTRYAGLSGVAAGVLALLAFLKLRTSDADPWFWRGALVLLAGKIAAETWLGRALFAHFTTTGTEAVPLAHLAGVACAAVAGFVRVRSFRGRRA